MFMNYELPVLRLWRLRKLSQRQSCALVHPRAYPDAVDSLKSCKQRRNRVCPSVWLGANHDSPKRSPGVTRTPFTNSAEPPRRSACWTVPTVKTVAPAAGFAVVKLGMSSPDSVDNDDHGIMTMDFQEAEMKKMPAGAFKANCLAVMDEVRTKRISVVITKRGTPVAKLVPIQTESDDIFGFFVGKGRIVGDVVSPILSLEEWGDLA